MLLLLLLGLAWFEVLPLYGVPLLLLPLSVPLVLVVLPLAEEVDVSNGNSTCSIAARRSKSSLLSTPTGPLPTVLSA
jgi:hypothetical protein